MISVWLDLINTDGNFLPVHCPHCGHVENLGLDCTDFWDCPKCGGEYWISLARMVTLREPPFTRAFFSAPVVEGATDQSLDKT